MAKDLTYYASIPDREAYEPTDEYWRSAAARAHDTDWGLTDRERWVCGLLRAWARAVMDFEGLNDAASDELHRRGEAEEQASGLRILVEKLTAELTDSENQVAGLRMQIGRLKKQVEKLKGEKDD